MLDLVQLLQYDHEFHQDHYNVMIYRLPKRRNYEFFYLERGKYTSASARMIFQSSRAFPGGVTAKRVCCARPSVLA